MQRSLSLVLLALLVSACAPIPSRMPTPLSWFEHQQRLEQLSYWHLDARIAVQTNSDGGSVSLRWTQDGDKYAIHIYGAFGAGSTLLTGDKHTAVLQTSDGKSYQASDAEQLFARHFGWWLPLSKLQMWLLGLPGQSDYALNSEARLKSLQQAGWQLDVSEYKVHDGLDLPSRLNVRSDSIRLRLLVENWLLQPRFVNDAPPRAPLRPERDQD